MIEHILPVTPDHLVNEVQQLQFAGYRFVTATSVDNDGTFDLLYTFDRQGAMRHLRIVVAAHDAVPSISRIYSCAVLVENEIKELFGVNITDIAIDYGGRLLLSEGAPETPMACKGGQITIVQREKN